MKTRWKKACIALLLNVNQTGSRMESIEGVETAKEVRVCVYVRASHRSGETSRSVIAYLFVGLETGYIKTGATYKREKLAKYNPLLRMEEELGIHAVCVDETDSTSDGSRRWTLHKEF